MADANTAYDRRGGVLPASMSSPFKIALGVFLGLLLFFVLLVYLASQTLMSGPAG